MIHRILNYHCNLYLSPACSPSQALLEAFVKTDIAFRNELNYRRKSKGLIQKDSHPGCTAITVLIVKDKLFVANAGDCRTIICRAGNPYALSRVRKTSIIFYFAGTRTLLFSMIQDKIS